MIYDDEPTAFERLQLLERRKRIEAYHIAAEPIIKKMCKLQLLFTSPWFVVNELRVVVESGVNWTDAEAANLYRAYEETLRTLQRMYLEPVS